MSIVASGGGEWSTYTFCRGVNFTDNSYLDYPTVGRSAYPRPLKKPTDEPDMIYDIHDSPKATYTGFKFSLYERVTKFTMYFLYVYFIVL